MNFNQGAFPVQMSPHRDAIRPLGRW
jgi:hypothetical protein